MVEGRDGFLSGYAGQRLLKEHDLEEHGIWQIFGEDPNCDFGGQHHSPSLGFARGQLNDVIDYAIKLPGFWQWGSGGDIKRVQVVELKKVDQGGYCDVL